MKQRVISIVLALALLCALLPVTGASAAPLFEDVSGNEWYAESVEYAVANGLMNGIGNNRFDPNGSMTRAMLVTVLWRYENAPEEGTNGFIDVPNGQWYTKAVAWAQHNAIVSGVSPTKFDPNGKITREQMATILYRYANVKGLDTSDRGNLYAFADQGQISSYAREAITWAVGARVIGGADDRLLPQGNATRAEVATILMRFIEKNKHPACEHDWLPATCFAPMTCAKCGKTNGDKLAHDEDGSTQTCTRCGYRIFQGKAVLYIITQNYAMGGGCSIFFFEDHTYEAVAGGVNIAVNADGTVPDPYEGGEDMLFISNGFWYQDDDASRILCENDDGNYGPVNVSGFTDPTVTKYDRILLGYWKLTSIYEPSAGSFTPAELGMSSDFAFYTDKIAELALNDDLFMLDFAFQKIDEEGNYLYYLYDGAEVYLLYYNVENDALLFNLGTSWLTYKK